MNPSDYKNLTFLIGLVLIFIMLACSKQEAFEKQKSLPGKNRPVPVLAAVVEQKTIPLGIKAVGNVDAYATVVVKTQIGGMITQQFVKDGQSVNKGDLLFTLDARPFEAALKEAKAKLERDRALLNKAQEDLNRYSRLLDKNVITPDQYEQVQSNLKSLQATIRLDEAGIEKAALDVEYASIRSPISGRVGSILLHQGNVVKANDDRPLCVINQIEPIWVSFSVPEQHLPAIFKNSREKKLQVSVWIEGEEASPEIGELAAIDNTVDKTTGTIKLKGVVSNEHHRLWPGQFVRVSLKIDDINDALIVPSQAVQTGIHGQFVYVVKADSTVDMRRIKIRRVMDTETIVGSGLTAGETVVTDGQILLAPGKSVEIKSGYKKKQEAS